MTETIGTMKCSRCLKWFTVDRFPTSCSALHGPHECCHLGQEEVQSPKPMYRTEDCRGYFKHLRELLT